MIELTEYTEKCFAEIQGGCSLLSEHITASCGYKCPFYKPRGCRDWVRVERGRRIRLYTPEEYIEKFTPKEKEANYWHVSKGVIK